MMTTDADDLETPGKCVRLFSEAMSRANNVIHDLENLDWIEASTEEFQDQLEEAWREARRVERILWLLCGKPTEEEGEEDVTASESRGSGEGREGDNGASPEDPGGADTG
jgi:hypothetical protein